MEAVIKLFDRRPYAITERKDGTVHIGTLPDLRKVILVKDLKEAEVVANNIGFRTLGGPGHVTLDDGKIVGGWYTLTADVDLLSDGTIVKETIWKRLEGAESIHEIAQTIWERSGYDGPHEFFIKAEAPYGILVMSLNDKKVCPIEINGFNPYKVIAEVMAGAEGEHYNEDLGAHQVGDKALAKAGDQITVLDLGTGESEELDPAEAALCLAGEGSLTE